MTRPTEALAQIASDANVKRIRDTGGPALSLGRVVRVAPFDSPYKVVLREGGWLYVRPLTTS